MARPTKLTPELQTKVCALIEAGNYAETACACAGISSSTFYSWRQRGEREEAGEYADFAAAVDEAEAQAERRAVVMVQMGMRDDPRLAMTFLERRFPKRWQRRPTPDSDAKPEVPSVVNVRIIDRVDEDGTRHAKTFEYIEDEEMQEIEQAAKHHANSAGAGNDGSSPPNAATVRPPAR